MGRHCYVCLACGRENTWGSNVRFFNLPTNPERRAKWLNSIKKPHLVHVQMSRDMRVCESHFTLNMYSKSMRRLKFKAVPFLEILKPKTKTKKAKNLALKKKRCGGKSAALRDIQMRKPSNGNVQGTPMSLKQSEAEVMVINVEPEDILMYEPVDVEVKKPKRAPPVRKSIPATPEEEAEILKLLDLLDQELEADL